MVISDSSGSVVERYQYGDYGEPMIHDAADDATANSLIGNTYLFTGRRYDHETGFYYFRTRYLESTGGRFTTRDSIGIWGDKRNIGNSYSYVGNDPLSYLDPFGLSGKSASGVNGSANSSEETQLTEEEENRKFWDQEVGRNNSRDKAEKIVTAAQKKAFEWISDRIQEATKSEKVFDAIGDVLDDLGWSDPMSQFWERFLDERSRDFLDSIPYADELLGPRQPDPRRDDSYFCLTTRCNQLLAGQRKFHKKIVEWMPWIIHRRKSKNPSHILPPPSMDDPGWKEVIPPQFNSEEFFREMKQWR